MFYVQQRKNSVSVVIVDLLSDIGISGNNILSDKAYETAQIRGYIESQNAKYTIPPKSNYP